MLEADRFLRKMARMIVGTLVQVGLGKLQVRHVEAMLQTQRRSTRVFTAPACGLMLDKVIYREPPQCFDDWQLAGAAAPLPGWPVVLDSEIPPFARETSSD